MSRSKEASMEEVIVSFFVKYWFFILLIATTAFVSCYFLLDRVPSTYGVKVLIQVARVPLQESGLSLAPKNSLFGAGSGDRILSKEIKDYIDFKFTKPKFTLSQEIPQIKEVTILESEQFLEIIAHGPTTDSVMAKIKEVIADVEALFNPYIEYNFKIINDEIEVYKVQQNHLKSKMNEINNVVSQVGMASGIISQSFELETKIMALDTIIMSLRKKLSPFELGNVAIIHMNNLDDGAPIMPQKTTWSLFVSIVVSFFSSLIFLFFHGKKYLLSGATHLMRVANRALPEEEEEEEDEEKAA